MIDRIKKNILIVILIAAVFYSISLIYFDVEALSNSLSEFPAQSIFFAILLVIISIIIKFFRWHYYLNTSSKKIQFNDSIIIFLSGLLMSISPGKIGELIKAILLKKRNNIPIVFTTSVVFAERIIEFAALLVITFFALIVHNYNVLNLLFVFFTVIIILIISTNRRSIDYILKLLSKSSILKDKMENLNDFRQNLGKLFGIQNFVFMFLISLTAWLFEISAFYLIISHFAFDSTFMFSIYAYSFSILAGALSMLPGGLISTETSLVYLMTNNGYTENIAVVSTILIRFLTIWFYTLIGIISYFVFLRNKTINEEELKNDNNFS